MDPRHVSDVRNRPLILFLCYLNALAWSLPSATIAAEPSYANKSLSTWLKAYQDAQSGSAAERQSQQALRSIGTNGIPYLLKMLAQDDLNTQQAAANTFEVLGPIGAPAVPQLAKMLTDTNPVIGLLAGTALGNIGPPALPSLMDALTNRHYGVGTRAALAIVKLGTNAAPALPIFLRDLKSPNHFVRERAADALGNLHIEPATVVPALTNLFDDVSPAAVCLSLQSLAAFETEARFVAPAIKSMFKDPNENVRAAATIALERIAPDLLTNSPAQ